MADPKVGDAYIARLGAHSMAVGQTGSAEEAGKTNVLQLPHRRIGGRWGSGSGGERGRPRSADIDLA